MAVAWGCVEATHGLVGSLTSIPEIGSSHPPSLGVKSAGGGTSELASKKLLGDTLITRAVSSILARSEKQPDVTVLERTYVESGVMPQLQNQNAQILYGRRGTGKSHVFRVLGAVVDRDLASAHVYIDVRVLGSAQLITDPDQPLTSRCVVAFRDLLNGIQNELLDMATDPARETPGNAIEAVDKLADAINEAAVAVSEKQISAEASSKSTDGVGGGIKASTTGIGAHAGVDRAVESAERKAESFSQAIRQTVVFAAVARSLDDALAAIGVDHFYILIDEWASLPADIQPYVAELLKRTVLPSSRMTLKLAALEYRSTFSIPLRQNNLIGFELGGDIAANMDLDDYYVHERTPTQVEGSFQQLLFKHLVAALPDGYLETEYNIKDPSGLRKALFTEYKTFVEVVRAGEGVIRDFLGVFEKAYHRAVREGRTKIDMNSVEQSARDWFQSDKSVSLSKQQETVLQRIVHGVIGTRRARSFLVEGRLRSHPMIQSLFDFRLLHLLKKGYSDKERPGVRYDIYTLDYGTYVHLKHTKSEPQLELIEGDNSQEDAVVPFDDKRSIRRIILDPSILDISNEDLAD